MGDGPRASGSSLALAGLTVYSSGFGTGPISTVAVFRIHIAEQHGATIADAASFSHDVLAQILHIIMRQAAEADEEQPDSARKRGVRAME